MPLCVDLMFAAEAGEQEMNLMSLDWRQDVIDFYSKQNMLFYFQKPKSCQLNENYQET
jgi:hypothetical protein